ncbi:hypothetical protein GCM10027589_21450 [Actinocorallia lasiicapitis]
MPVSPRGSRVRFHDRPFQWTAPGTRSEPDNRELNTQTDFPAATTASGPSRPVESGPDFRHSDDVATIDPVALTDENRSPQATAPTSQTVL